MLNPSLSTNLKDKLLLSLPSQDANAIATFSILGKIANIRLPFLVNQQLAIYLAEKSKVILRRLGLFKDHKTKLQSVSEIKTKTTTRR